MGCPSHGTHVSGTIAARENDIGVVGVAPGATLYVVKVLNNQAMHTAICKSVKAGVTYAVAAGNSAADSTSYTPGRLRGLHVR